MVLFETIRVTNWDTTYIQIFEAKHFLATFALR